MTMLAVFEKSVGLPPEELSLPSSGRKAPAKSREEIVGLFGSKWPQSTFYHFSGGSLMAMSHADESPVHPRSVVGIEDIFCFFIGNIENIGDLRRHYGLDRHANEAMLIVDIYIVLRDRAPYPPDQVFKDLAGKFAFVLFDTKSKTVFAARDRDGGVKLQWGAAGDGSLVFSDDSELLADVCGVSGAAFPAGCIFMNKTGLVSFVHPLYKVRGYTREDNEGNVSGVYFQVDLYSRIPSIPRVGSTETWGAAATAMEEA